MVTPASHHRRPLAVGLGLLLISCAAAAAEQAPRAASSLHERVEEVVRALQNTPRLRSLNERQRIERVEFVVGNTLFALLHEIGHVVIAELNLPLLGREEEAADTYATIRMLRVGTIFSEHALA